MKPLIAWFMFIALGAINLAHAHDIAGEWDWGAGGGRATIRADGTGADGRGNTMTWVLQNAPERSYRFVWSHGFTDTAVLSSDGNTLDVVNNVGTRFRCTRRAEAADETAAGPPGDSQPGISRSVSADSIGAIAGRWKWGAGAGQVSINADGTGTNDRGGTMVWTIKDVAKRVYELRWNNGYTDIATLSQDAKTLAIVNNAGTRFSAERIGDPAPPTPPAQLIDLTGSWNGGLVHIWQDGSRLVVTAAWRRQDGRAVCWLGEGTLTGHTADLRIVYSPMALGPGHEWHGILTVSSSGNELSAVYTQPGSTSRDERSYSRDR